MLSYLGTGMRNYGTMPYQLSKRGHWELQCVIKGAIGMMLPGQPSVLRQSWLWISPPGHMHGWTGDGRKSAEVAVFHFPSIPEPLTRLAHDGEVIDFPLSVENRNRVRVLSGKASSYRDRPAAGMMLCHEHVLLELSLMIYESLINSQTDTALENDRRVGDALRWFSGRIAENPGLEQVADAANLSPSQLRRLFHEVLGVSPKHAFDQLRFQLATQLMADPNIKLVTVSTACGFESQSAFSRAFKTKFACAPEVWRGHRLEAMSATDKEHLRSNMHPSDHVTKRVAADK